MSTGSIIREARQAEGLTQAALARRLGITQPSVARLEAAGDEVTVATLQRALNAMGRALVLQAVEQRSSVDETLLTPRIGRSAGELIEQFEREYAATRSLAIESRESGRASSLRPGELLGRIAAAGVDFVMVGDLAAILRGSSSGTRVLEITCAPDDVNLERLRELLSRVDARLRGVTDAVPFLPDDRTLQGTRALSLWTSSGPMNLMQLAASSYVQLRERADVEHVVGVEVRIASLGDLIAMKKAAGRPKDLVAVEELEAIERLRRTAG